MGNKKQGKVARFRIQRRFGTELPGLGKPGALDRRPYPPDKTGIKDENILTMHLTRRKTKNSSPLLSS